MTPEQDAAKRAEQALAALVELDVFPPDGVPILVRHLDAAVAEAVKERDAEIARLKTRTWDDAEKRRAEIAERDARLAEAWELWDEFTREHATMIYTDFRARMDKILGRLRDPETGSPACGEDRGEL